MLGVVEVLINYQSLWKIPASFSVSQTIQTIPAIINTKMNLKKGGKYHLMSLFKVSTL